MPELPKEIYKESILGLLSFLNILFIISKLIGYHGISLGIQKLKKKN